MFIYIVKIVMLFLSGINFASTPPSLEAIVQKEANNQKPQLSAEAPLMIINADAAVVWDVRSQSAIFSQRANEQHAIASITKLMTALVFLEHNPGWDSVYEIKSTDLETGGKLYLGEKVKVRDLFSAMLVGSDNTAAAALTSATGLSRADFVKAMNRKALDLGLSQTNFIDPIGLEKNMSNALEVAKLTKAALDNLEIARAVASPEIEFSTVSGEKKKFSSTNYLLNSFSETGMQIIGGKTGHTDVAGYCLAAKFSDSAGHTTISVVLGAESEADRFSETAKLARFAYRYFKW